MTVCPVCNTEGMNPVWKQGDNVFLSVCETCEAFSVVSISESWHVPIEMLITDFGVSLVGLMFGISRWFQGKVAKLTTSVRKAISM